MDQLNHLDKIAARLAGNHSTTVTGYGPLSTGERVYVALAANRPDLLAADGHTLVEAWARLDWDWRTELLARWQYGTPAHAAAARSAAPR